MCIRDRTQVTHLASEAPPFAYDPDKAAGLRVHLGAILKCLEDIALTLSRGAKP